MIIHSFYHCQRVRLTGLLDSNSGGWLRAQKSTQETRVRGRSGRFASEGLSRRCQYLVTCSEEGTECPLWNLYAASCIVVAMESGLGRVVQAEMARDEE